MIKKLTPEQAYAIYTDTRRPLKVIAYDYGVSVSTIHSIVTGKTHGNTIRRVIAHQILVREASQKRKQETAEKAEGKTDE